MVSLVEKHFESVGEVKVGRLTSELIQTAEDLIYNTYQHEKIWVNYSRQEIREELLTSFENKVYKPVYFVAMLNDKMIGIASYMVAHISSQAYELSFGTVHPEYQRKGIGKWLTYLRLQAIYKGEPDAVIFTRARRPKLFEHFNFQYIHRTNDVHGCGDYHYMFCIAKEINFEFINHDSDESQLYAFKLIQEFRRGKDEVEACFRGADC